MVIHVTVQTLQTVQNRDMQQKNFWAARDFYIFTFRGEKGIG